jgi:hypothetical protein
MLIELRIWPLYLRERFEDGGLLLFTSLQPLELRRASETGKTNCKCKEYFYVKNMIRNTSVHSNLLAIRKKKKKLSK